MTLKKLFRRALRAVRLQIRNTAREVHAVRGFVARQLTPPPRPPRVLPRSKGAPQQRTRPAAQRRRDDRMLAELLGSAAPDTQSEALDLAAWGITNAGRPDVRSVVDRLLAAVPGTAAADAAWRDYLQLHGGQRRRRAARPPARRSPQAPAKPKPVKVHQYQKGDGTAVKSYRRSKR